MKTNSSLLYKVYNHCTRILFLLRIYKYLKKTNQLSANQKIYTTTSQLNKRLEKFYKLLETDDVRKSYCSKFSREIKQLLDFLFPNSMNILKNKKTSKSSSR